MQRNITLDYFKIFLAILVIFIHLTPLFHDPILHLPFGVTLDLNWAISDGIARIAVPCFFLINGYFFNSQSWAKTRKYITRLLLLYVVWTLLYLPLFWGEPIVIRISYLILGYQHLWYLSALIVAVPLLFYLDRIVKNKLVLLFVAVVLFLLGCYMQRHGGYTSKSRNFLFFCFPFLFLGYYLKKYNLIRIRGVYLLITFTLGILLFILEVSFRKMTLGRADMYASFLFICPALLLMVLKKSSYKGGKDYLRDFSTAIFLVHPYVVDIAKRIFTPSDNLYLFPIVLICTMFLVVVIYYLNKRVKIFL